MADNFLEELAADDEAGDDNFLHELTQESVAAPVVQKKDPWWKKKLREASDPKAWGRAAGVAGRGVIEGLTDVVSIPADAAIGLRNVLTGSNYEGVGSMLGRELDEVGLPRAESGPEKLSQMAASMLTSSRLPSPKAAGSVPANYAPTLSPQQAILQKTAKDGLVVPPTTVKPTALNKAAEGFAGKLSTAQQASLANQPAFNEMAKRALGLGADDALSPATLENVRKTAGKVYEQIADAGDIAPDPQFLDDLARLGRSSDEIAQAFPGANVGANKQIGEIVDSLLQNKFSSKAALQYLRELRKQASGNLSGMNAADPTKQALGMAQREAAASLEDLIGRHLESIGKGDVAKSLAGARKQIAMAHTVEDALNESTGNVVASKLAKALAKGKPLSGDLETIAQFAQAFPKASREIVESLPGVSPLDYAAAVGGAILTKSPGPLAALTLRPTARNAILSPWWQRGLQQKPFVTSENIGVAPAALMQAGQE